MKNARKRSNSPSSDRAKRAKEAPLGERERPRGVSGHSGKPLKEVQPLRREDLSKRLGGSRRAKEGCEVKIRETEDWAWSQRRPRAQSQDSVVVEAHIVRDTRRTYEDTSRSRREALSSHSRIWTRPRTRSRSADCRRSSKSSKTKESRRK